MWLDPFFTSDWLQDLLATILTFAVALGWLRLMDALAHRGWIEQRLSRNIIHIRTGPLLVLCWDLFIPPPAAPFPSGDPRALLRGPLYSGLVFVLCPILFWRPSPVGTLALMLMCGGDGRADVVG